MRFMTETDTVTKIALDYIEGWYEANKDRMQNALNPELVKRRFVTQDEIWKVDTPIMLQITSEGRGKLEDPKTGRRDVTILDISQNMASVKIVSEKFIDYLHMIKLNDKWSIVGALWDYIEK